RADGLPPTWRTGCRLPRARWWTRRAASSAPTGELPCTPSASGKGSASWLSRGRGTSWRSTLPPVGWWWAGARNWRATASFWRTCGSWAIRRKGPLGARPGCATGRGRCPLHWQGMCSTWASPSMEPRPDRRPFCTPVRTCSGAARSPPRAASSARGCGSLPLVPAHRMLHPVDVLVLCPEAVIETAILAADRRDGAIAEANRAEALGERLDRKVAVLERILPHVLGCLAGIGHSHEVVGADHRQHGRLGQVEDLE